MKIFRWLVLLVVVVGLALRVSGVPVSSSLLWVAAAGETCLVALVIYGLVRVIKARARNGEDGPHGWDGLRGALRETLPEGVTEAVLSEARVFVAALRTLARRPIKPVEVKSGWRRFGAMETSSYGHVVTMLLLLIVVESPAVHMILGALMKGSPLLGVIRGVLLGSNIYLALWLIGDLRLLRETPGVLLGQGELAVEMGLRANGRVGLDVVTGAQSIVGLDTKAADGLRAIRITPQPSPNCRIRLRSPVLIRGILGIPLRGEMIDIYVDDPTGLVSSIETAIQRS